jgi:hypothetical protein
MFGSIQQCKGKRHFCRIQSKCDRGLSSERTSVDYITKLRRQRAEVIQNNENEKFATLEKAKPGTENVILGDG